MNKYKINYSVTIEAETQQDAVNIFFESVPQNVVMQCSVSPDGENIYDIIKDMASDQKKQTFKLVQMMSMPTNKQQNKEGHTLCECGEGVHLHKAGYETDLHMCAVCRCMVVDPVDFEQNNVS